MQRNDIVERGRGEERDEVGEAVEVEHLDAALVRVGGVKEREVVRPVVDRDGVIEPEGVVLVARIQAEEEVVRHAHATRGDREAGLDAEEFKASRRRGVEVEVNVSIALNDRVRALTLQERVLRVEHALRLDLAFLRLGFFVQVTTEASITTVVSAAIVWTISIPAAATAIVGTISVATTSIVRPISITTTIVLCTHTKYQNQQ